MKGLRFVLIVPLVVPLLGFDDAPPHFYNQLEEGVEQRGAAVRLQQRVNSVKLERASLSTVLRQVETGVGMRIVADWGALKKVGVTPNSEITLQGRDVPYTQYFEAIAEQMGAGIGIYLQGDGAIGFTASAAVPVRGGAGRDSSAFRSLVPPAVRTASAPRTAGVRRGKKQPFDTPAEEATRNRLETNVNTFVFQRAPIGQVLDSLQDICGAPFHINWEALEAAGVFKDTPVSIKLMRVPARSVLQAILAEVAAASLGYTINDGMVAISTRDDLNSAKYQVVRVFDIRDMLVPRSRPQNEYSHDDMVKEIVDTIKTTVAPESWRDAGGQIGSLRELDGKLIINQTEDNHRAVAALLELLRDKPLAKKKK